MQLCKKEEKEKNRLEIEIRISYNIITNILFYIRSQYAHLYFSSI